MQPDPKRGESPAATQDRQNQAVVLRHVLEVFPGRLTIPDLVRELTGDSEAFSDSDAYERAVRDLTGVGLVRCPGGIIEPTRAALHFFQLSEA